MHFIKCLTTKDHIVGPNIMIYWMGSVVPKSLNQIKNNF
ncbi:Uncharacterised protein [uncultured archaeon]|nr:Uncharacterised protein [uncultured archaeon]